MMFKVWDNIQDLELPAPCWNVFLSLRIAHVMLNVNGASRKKQDTEGGARGCLPGHSLASRGCQSIPCMESLGCYGVQKLRVHTAQTAPQAHSVLVPPTRPGGDTRDREGVTVSLVQQLLRGATAGSAGRIWTPADNPVLQRELHCVLVMWSPARPRDNHLRVLTTHPPGLCQGQRHWRLSRRLPTGAPGQ